MWVYLPKCAADLLLQCKNPSKEPPQKREVVVAFPQGGALPGTSQLPGVCLSWLRIARNQRASWQKLAVPLPCGALTECVPPPPVHPNLGVFGGRV